MSLDDLPTMDQIAAERAGKSFPKGKSRLEVKAEAKPLTVVDEKTFKAIVWKRDHGRCRMCGRKVIKTLARVPERGDCHHIHGRTGDLRFETRAALLVCATDHERLTGRVAEKWRIVPTQTFTVRGVEYTDARYPVKFERIA